MLTILGFSKESNADTIPNWRLVKSLSERILSIVFPTAYLTGGPTKGYTLPLLLEQDALLFLPSCQLWKSLSLNIHTTHNKWSSSQHQAKKVREKKRKKIEISLFSTASPLFFKISAMVTTVAIAVHVTTWLSNSTISPITRNMTLNYLFDYIAAVAINFTQERQNMTTLRCNSILFFVTK